MWRIFLAPLLFLLIFSTVQAQDFSNKGKDFWVGYGYHHGMNTGNDQNMVLYFTSNVQATVKVEIPAVGWVKTYTVNANAVAESDIIPKTGSQDARLLSEGVYNTGIHITSDVPVVAYAHIYNSSVSGATLLFPVNTLGRDYYSLNFTQRSNADNSNSWAYVVATEDNTAVEIIPSANTLTHAAGTSFIVPLNKGQIYNLMGVTSGTTGVDLTGTRIRSISTGTTGCKKIAVFSGSGRLSINCSNLVTTSDNVIQQDFPKSAWGKKYLTVPTSNLPNNFFRIAVSDPSTTVKVDGVTATNLINGFYYEIMANTPKSIIADKPVMVAQYITSTNGAGGATCGNFFSGDGDPEMIYLSPVEQTIDNITLNSTGHFNITKHYINVVIKSSSINSFSLDGTSQQAAFMTHPKDAAYSYAVFSVAEGAHNLKADSGFNAIAYGYGLTESYGYNAGTNIKDLYQFISLQTQYTTVNSPLTCRNTPFLFAITLQYQPTSLTWDFGNSPNLIPAQTVNNNNPVADSSFLRDGKTLYVYKLPSVYRFTAGGVYPVKIFVNSPSVDGCSGQQEIDYDIQVSATPVSNFTFSHSGCATDTALFTDASNGNGRQIIQWHWNFGDGSPDTVKNPHKVFSAAGNYNVKLTAVNDIGCSADTVKILTIAPQPVAKFGFTKFTCANSLITFTDSSTIPIGTISKWYWDFGNGNIITNTTNAAVTQTYSSVGSYTITLQVENSSGCKSTIYSQTIEVTATPTISFDMPGACLPNAKAPFTNLSTISDGSESTLNWLWDFGDGSTSAVKEPVHTYTTAGPFNVRLTATSDKGCSKDSAKNFNNIFPSPVAAFNNNPVVACVTDSMHYIDASTAANSAVSRWYWNLGDATTSTLQNPVKKYAGSGSYEVSLAVTSLAGCTSDTVKKTIVISAPPLAAFSITGSTCSQAPVTITDQSNATTGSIVSWIWDFGNGKGATYQNNNPFTVTYPDSGNFIISLVAVTGNGCKSDSAKQTIAVQPVPIANFIAPQVCVNDPSANFADSSYMPGDANASLQYFWNFDQANTSPNSPVSTNRDPQYKYGKAGAYSVLHTVTNAATGCSSSVVKQVSINGALLQADFALLNTGALCSNAKIDLQNNSSVDFGGVTKIELLWDAQNNPNIADTIINPVAGTIFSHSYPFLSTTQTYQAKMRAFSGASCVNEKVVPITINATPKVAFSAVPVICLNDSIRTITQVAETTGQMGTFAFSGNGVSTSGQFNPAVAGPGNSVITYSYTSSGGCMDSASQTIEVVANPVVILKPRLFVLDGGTVTLDPAITGNASLFAWSPGTYLDNANIRNPRSTPLENLSYRLKATSPEGCSGYGEVSISLLKSLEISNAFSPNGDGVNDVWNIPALASYPDCIVEVFNRYGKIVYHSIGYEKPWNGTYNGSDLPIGVYYYIIDPKNGRNRYNGSVTILR